MHIHGHGTGERFRAGFTVLELMIALSIASILLLLAIPAFQQFSFRQQMKAAVGTLHYDLMMGRSEAVHLNTSVVTCPGNPQAGCSDAEEWSGGWIVFTDSNGDRQRQQTEELVRHGQGFESMRIRSSSGRSNIRFFPQGSAPGSNGTITFCGRGGPDNARKLVISNLGRIRRDTAQGIDPAFCPT